MDVQEQILEALVQRDVDEYIKNSADPRSQKIFHEMMSHAQTAIIAAMEQDGEPREAIDAEVAGFTASLQLIVPSPETIGLYREMARKKYTPKKTMTQALQSIEQGFDLNTVERPLDAALMDDLRSRVVDVSPRVLSELVSLAKTKGLDYALTPEAHCEVLRGIFPARDAYLAHKREALHKFIGMFNVLGRMLAISPRAEHQRNAVAFAGISDMFRGLGEMYEMIDMQREEAKADRIYGPQSSESTP